QSFPLTVMSGDVWKISLGDGLLTLSLILLFIEVIKAARTSRREILTHALAMLTFAGALAEFIVLKGFATSVFFLITVVCLFDVVAGLSIVAVQREVAAPPPEPE